MRADVNIQGEDLSKLSKIIFHFCRCKSQCFTTMISVSGFRPNKNFSVKNKFQPKTTFDRVKGGMAIEKMSCWHKSGYFTPKIIQNLLNLVYHTQRAEQFLFRLKSCRCHAVTELEASPNWHYLLYQLYMISATNQLTQDLCNLCVSFYAKLDAEIFIGWAIWGFHLDTVK